MKTQLKRILLISLSLIMIFSFVSCKDDVQAPEGYKLASNLDYVDYYLFVPNDWVIYESSTMTTAYVSNEDKTSVSVIQRNKTSTEEADAAWWYENYYIPYLNNTFGEDSGKLIQKGNEDCSVDDISGKKYYIDIEIAGETYNYIVICIFTNASFYCITYTSKDELYTKNMEAFNNILSNFKFD